VSAQNSSADSATPASAILLVLGAGLSFSFLDASAKYLVLGGMAAPFVSWVRFAVHLVLFVAVFRPWTNPGMLRARSLPLQLRVDFFLFSCAEHASTRADDVNFLLCAHGDYSACRTDAG
jgi:hypothetical protein